MKIRLLKALVWLSGNVWLRELDFKRHWREHIKCLWNEESETSPPNSMDRPKKRMTGSVRQQESGVEQSLLESVKGRKLTYFRQVMRKEVECLEKDIIQGTITGTRRRGRPRTSWISNITSWTRCGMGQLLQTANDRDAWRTLGHSATNPRSEDGWRQDKARQYARAGPNMGDLVQGNTLKLGWNRGGVTQEHKNLQYLRNGARWDQGYYDGLIGSRWRAFDWYQNQWPWMTLNGISRDCPSF